MTKQPPPSRYGVPLPQGEPPSRYGVPLPQGVPLPRTLTLVCWGILFFSQIAWWGWLAAEPPVPRALLIAAFAGPLLLPLRGLLHDRPRSYFWFTLLVMPYFAFAVAALVAAAGAHAFAWVQTVAAVAGMAASFFRTRRMAQA